MGAKSRWRARIGRLRPTRVAVVVIGLAALAYGVTHGVETVRGPQPACTFAAPGRAGYRLDPDQTQQASIIAAVGYRLGLPDHAVTVALATALQESHLRNLTYGDRDSVGLFQQRPSQGWGTRAEILDPVYTATVFYQRLRLVPDWPTIPVTEAAQAVQHSAAPTAYARWGTQAQAMAVDLTGESPAGLACRLPSFGGAPPAPGALQAEAVTELGTDPLSPDPGPQTGWRYAAWLVGHAYNYHLHTVSYAGRRWTATSGRWVDQPAADTATVAVG